jgi:glutathione S-transferase
MTADPALQSRRMHKDELLPMNTPPILYSFRRCPYAMRARMALVYAGIRVELREVKLASMPESMLRLSPKATVPVLVLADGRVIDESLDVMLWSLSQGDPRQWLEIDADSHQLIRRCDEDFKPLLDYYKYADRHPRLSQVEHRLNAQFFLQELDRLLSRHAFITDSQCRLADVAIFPFIRQFAGVDVSWFEQCEYAALRGWLNTMRDSDLFKRVMQKYPLWQPGDATLYL